MDPSLLALLEEADGLYERVRDASMSDFKDLLAEVERTYEIIADQIANRRSSQARFNVFVLTDRAHFEITTHQAIIANLLDPRGTHDQGNLFLEPFLALVTKCSGIQLAPPNGLWEVDHGLAYIDVRLRYPATNDSVIIETKWDAPDRPGQVVDYWRNELERTGNPRIPLVFLTKDGRRPALGESTKDRDRVEKDLICISFGDEFANLLAGLLPQVKSKKVRETLYQYLELLRKLPMAKEE
jgi:hypothetical protein